MAECAAVAGRRTNFTGTKRGLKQRWEKTEKTEKETTPTKEAKIRIRAEGCVTDKARPH